MTTSSTGLRSFYGAPPQPAPETTASIIEEKPLKEIQTEEVVIPIVNNAEIEYAENKAKRIGKWGWTLLLVGVISAVITVLFQLFF